MNKLKKKNQSISIEELSANLCGYAKLEFEQGDGKNVIEQFGQDVGGRGHHRYAKGYFYKDINLFFHKDQHQTLMDLKFEKKILYILFTSIRLQDFDIYTESNISILPAYPPYICVVDEISTVDFDLFKKYWHIYCTTENITTFILFSIFFGGLIFLFCFFVLILYWNRK